MEVVHDNSIGHDQSNRALPWRGQHGPGKPMSGNLKYIIRLSLTLQNSFEPHLNHAWSPRLIQYIKEK